MSDSSPIAVATRDQGAAIRPELSVWVTASAGSGKTKVLTERVLALLLAETPPQRILCLTFTKAAAAEMSNRINEKLAAWVTADEDSLYREIMHLAPDYLERATWEGTQRVMNRARRLFAEVLDAPGGLQIATIHAFCQSLLRRFPLEARVSPHFSLMDDRDAAEGLADALEDTIARARGGADDLALALSVLTARVHETNFADLMTALLAARGKLKRLIEAHGGLEAAVTAMRAALGLNAGESESMIIASATADASIDRQGLQRAADALAQGSATDKASGAGIAAWLATPAERADTFEAYAQYFLTAGQVRKRLATKTVADTAGVLEALLAEATRLASVAVRVKAARIAEGTAALMHLGAEVLARYETEKANRSLMDYDDLIQATRRLLARPGLADWVLYKLDGGIDHILTDEAQDTNPDQWEIVTPLLREFFAGLGRREDVAENPRTVFAVGDRKQSIYSFQGASPDAFNRVHRDIMNMVMAAEQRWADVTMNVSFRSAPVVLDAVNAVFAAGGPARDGVAADEDIIHLSARAGAAGLVEIWPLVEPEACDPPASWKPPVERRKGDSPQNRLAALIAHRIGKMIAEGEVLSSEGRPIRPGDIMVLVRRRTGFVEELVRQLKKLKIAVAGVDRMVLSEQMAIMDLVALGDILLLPEDDLTLATVLKGPLVGLSEDDLFALAHDRGEKCLWAALSAHAGSDGRFGAAHKFLAALMAKTDYLTPAELYGHILVALDGRRKLLVRLGSDADDPIDEFMNLALSYQVSHAPTLQGFLHWLAAGNTEIKRDLDQSGGNAVRVITVHGAKGLEAPIVFLPDTAQLPTMRNPLLWNAGETPLLFWAAKVDDLDPVSMGLRKAAELAQEREYHRLLYVAMTRARDRLYVCGWQNKRPGKLDATWYGMIKTGLQALPQTQEIVGAALHHVGLMPEDVVLRLESKQEAALERKPAAKDLAAARMLPSWGRCDPAPELSPPRPLAPSRAAAEPPVLSPLKNDGRVRYQRGVIIHRLLQSLPDIPQARRRAAAEDFVRRGAWGLELDAAAAIVAETLAVLDTPDFAPLFAAGSRAEVSLTGLVGKHIIAGQVDRLAVTATEVWIIDYKTNRPPPRDKAKVDPAYILQMATYRAALQAIYPGQNVHCVLLWTDGPFTMVLDHAQMDAALRQTGLLQ